MNVAAGVAPAVEGGILPPDEIRKPGPAQVRRIPLGNDAQLYGRRDACRYNSRSNPINAYARFISV